MQTIGYCKTNNLEEALIEVKEILDLKVNKFANEGCLFPFTVS